MWSGITHSMLRRLSLTRSADARFSARHQCAVWLDGLATVRRSAINQQTPSARRPATWTCWTRQQLRRNSQVLSRILPCFGVTRRRLSRISAGHVTGSIPGSSTTEDARTLGKSARRWAESACRAAGFEPRVLFESVDRVVHTELVETGHAA